MWPSARMALLLYVACIARKEVAKVRILCGSEGNRPIDSDSEANNTRCMHSKEEKEERRALRVDNSGYRFDLESVQSRSFYYICSLRSRLYHFAFSASFMDALLS